jgi:hypothetical protein
MSLWAQALIWVLAFVLALAALAILLLALVHFRYRVAWTGIWLGMDSVQRGEARIEFGFPGFMRRWDWASRDPDDTPPSLPSCSPAVPDVTDLNTVPAVATVTRAAESYTRPNADASGNRAASVEDTPSVEYSATGPTPIVPEHRTVHEAPTHTPQKKQGKSRDPHRYRKALFRLATDGPAWGMLVRYGFRMVRRFHALLGPRLEVAVGHPDPALLGRAAGYWYAATPVTHSLPLGKDLVMGFRFQDPAPTLRVRAEGGFSGLSLLLFGMGAVGGFPFFGLARRAWHGWRHREMQGWRAWTYRRIQTL